MFCMAVMLPFVMAAGVVFGVLALGGWLAGKAWESQAAERGRRWQKRNGKPWEERNAAQEGQ